MLPGVQYRIGDGNDSWTDWRRFATGPYSRPDFVRKGDSVVGMGEGVGAVFADLGLSNGVSAGRLRAEAEAAARQRRAEAEEAARRLRTELGEQHAAAAEAAAAS